MLNCSPAVESFGYLAFHQISIAEKKLDMTDEVKQNTSINILPQRTRIKYYKYMSIEEKLIQPELKKSDKDFFQERKVYLFHNHHLIHLLVPIKNTQIGNINNHTPYTILLLLRQTLLFLSKQVCRTNLSSYVRIQTPSRIKASIRHHYTFGMWDSINGRFSSNLGKVVLIVWSNLFNY